MTDLTAAANLRFIGELISEKIAVDSSTGQTIYRGQPMIIDQTVDTINLTPFVDALVVAATDVFMGIALSNLTVTSGDDQTVKESGLSIAVEPSIVGFVSSVFTNADLGKTIYMSDSGVLSVTAADNPQIGILYLIQDGYAYVRLETPKVTTGA